MGKIRARTDEELAARRQEILTVAAEQLMTEEYEAITLATIAAKTSISRTSMYTYYDTKEAVFVDLMINEYEKLERELRNTFGVKMRREDFCKALSGILWQHPILLKLLSFQLSVWDRRYDDSLVKRFVVATQPYMQTLNDILMIQFPDADGMARNMFKLQFSVYCNSLYTIEHLPESHIDAMIEHTFFDSIPPGEQICCEGLMLLSAGLE